MHITLVIYNSISNKYMSININTLKKNSSIYKEVFSRL